MESHFHGDGKPFFVGKDIADILGYQNGSRDINRHVDEDDYLDGVTIRASIGRCCSAN